MIGFRAAFSVPTYKGQHQLKINFLMQSEHHSKLRTLKKSTFKKNPNTHKPFGPPEPTASLKLGQVEFQ